MNFTDDDFMRLVHRVNDLERRVVELEKTEAPSITDGIADTVTTARRGLSGILSKASKAIGGGE